MSSFADSIRDALSGADNPTAAGIALASWARLSPPEFETERDAIRVASEQALRPFFPDATSAKAVAWAVLDTVWAERSAPSMNGRPSEGAQIVRLSTVQPEKVSWLWPGRIPFGKLTLLDGDPGLGKSSLTLDLAARLSNGDAMPDGSLADLDTLAGTVLLTAEDGLADTIRPRFDAMGGNAELVVALQAVGDRLPTIGDLDAIEEAVSQVDARLVVIDPIMAHLDSKVNSNTDQHARRALAPLIQLCERLGAALVAVRHLNKGDARAIYRGGGSIGFVASARAAFLVAEDPDDEEKRILAPIKSNLGPKAASLVFRLEAADNGAARVRWAGETAHRADQLLSIRSEEERSALDDAKEFLLGELKDGPRPAQEILNAAKAGGIVEKTLRRAKGDLGIEAKRHGFGADGEWRWNPPAIGGQGESPSMVDTAESIYGNGVETCGHPPDPRSIDVHAELGTIYGEEAALAADLDRALGEA